jgi:hypothetical protein
LSTLPVQGLLWAPTSPPVEPRQRRSGTLSLPSSPSCSTRGAAQLCSSTMKRQIVMACEWRAGRLSSLRSRRAQGAMPACALLVVDAVCRRGSVLHRALPVLFKMRKRIGVCYRTRSCSWRPREWVPPLQQSSCAAREQGAHHAQWGRSPTHICIAHIATYSTSSCGRAYGCGYEKRCQHPASESCGGASLLQSQQAPLLGVFCGACARASLR